MQRRSLSHVLSGLDNAQQNALESKRVAIGQDINEQRYDKRAVKALMKYVTDKKHAMATLNYLRSLTNDKGERFCRSSGHYSDMRAQFDNFAKREKGNFTWSLNFRRAQRIVEDRYSQAKLKVLEYNSDADIKDAVDDWSTSAGWEQIVYFKQGVSKKKDLLPQVYSRYREEEEQALRVGSFNKPILTSYRTQGSGAFTPEGKPTGTWKSKKRAVNMVDMFVVIAESKFGDPLNRFLTSYPYSAIGKNDDDIANILNKLRMQYPGYISLDYSKYDSTIPSWLIHAAFQVLRMAFVDMSEKDSNLLDVIEEDFTYKWVLTGEGFEYYTHGNPSGSKLTSIINGICNELITESWLSAFKVNGQYMIMGDDNIIYTNMLLTPDTVYSVGTYITHNYGIKVNHDKTTYGDSREDPEFLSRFWGHRYPYRTLEDLIMHIAFPERFRDYCDPDKALDPELIVFAYYLGSKPTFWNQTNYMQVYNVRLDDFQHLKWSREQMNELPYNIRTVLLINKKTTFTT